MNALFITLAQRALPPGLLILFCLGCGFNANAQTTRYLPSAVANVWLSSDLRSDAVLPAAADDSCPQRYEKVPGTRFCLVPDTSLTMRENIYLVDKSSEADCRKGFSRPRENSLLCLDHQLALVWADEALTLVLQRCPDGFVDAATTTGCAPATTGQQHWSSSPLRCKPGYMIVNNLDICVANNVALKTSSDMNFGLRPSDGLCGQGRKRIHEGGFCLPARALTECSAKTLSCATDDDSTLCLSATEDMDCCPLENLSVHDIPRFDGDAFATEEIFSCTLGPGSVIPKCDELDFISTLKVH